MKRIVLLILETDADKFVSEKAVLSLERIVKDRFDGKLEVLKGWNVEDPQK